MIAGYFYEKSQLVIIFSINNIQCILCVLEWQQLGAKLQQPDK
ncbi:MAG: hypothetical protein Rsou_1449 [Candidatus Ruthia sp. Asou_11_S2]|nr:hypothetical protein [Candidatus Ruthia sp. Asou_11_S2]